MFDVDNSGMIVVEEIHDSVKVRRNIWEVFCICQLILKWKRNLFQSVWKILDGIGDAIDGTVEEISEFLYERLIHNGKSEVKHWFHKWNSYKKIVQVDLSEFVKLCLLDKSLGDSVMKIFRAVISKI